MLDAGLLATVNSDKAEVDAWLAASTARAAAG